MLSTVLLVAGALLVGDALNGAVVTSQYGITSPAAVIRLVVGAVFILGGYRLKTPMGEYVDVPSGDVGRHAPGGDETGSAGAEGNGEFDPELSPVGDSLEHVDADEENRQ